MYRNTILRCAICDVKSLPLGATEGFVLSQIDGALTLEEVASIAGLELSVALRLARRLLDLGAVTTVEAPDRPAASLHHATPSPTIRAEEAEEPPRPRSRTQRPPARSVSPKAGTTVPPAAVKSVRPPTPREQCASLPAADDPCDLDDAMRAEIVALEASIDQVDHYTILGVERTANKRTIRRAYAALAARFHPDRFYNKKLGPMRGPIDRIFRCLSNAHDVLLDPDTRAAYDAKLGPEAPKAPSAPPRRKTSRAMKAVRVSSSPPCGESKTQPARRKTSRAMKAVATTTPVAPSSKASPPDKPETVPQQQSEGRAVPAVATTMQIPPSISSAPETPGTLPPRAQSGRPLPPRPISLAPSEAGPPSSPDSLRLLYATRTQADKQRRVDVFLRAAEDALKRDDVIGAANHFHLALQNHEDPDVRRRLEDVEALARNRQYELSMTRGTAAERDERWAEAATHLAKAHSIRSDSALAARASRALLKSQGDLHEAARLAEQAVASDPKNVSYRLTLGEVYFAAGLFLRASREAARALELAPKDTRAKELAAAASKASKA